MRKALFNNRLFIYTTEGKDIYGKKPRRKGIHISLDIFNRNFIWTFSYAYER